jgi:hypothetical protein
MSRPFGITALAILFVIGTIASSISFVSLTFLGSFLEPAWRLNPHAREAFARMGMWAIGLVVLVCAVADVNRHLCRIWTRDQIRCPASRELLHCNRTISSAGVGLLVRGDDARDESRG